MNAAPTLLWGLALAVAPLEALASTNFVPIYSWMTRRTPQRLTEHGAIPPDGKLTAVKLFLALAPDGWSPGFIPVYSVEREGRFELRRTPPKGEEQQMEPLFFALPPADESPVRQIAGQWQCTATRGQSSDAWFTMQLTLVGERISGRFDPSTDYRVASIDAGSFLSNRVNVTVAYINESYQLQGEWRDGTLSGTWEKHDREESGRWQATRDNIPFPATATSERSIPLLEWRHGSNGPAVYTISTNPPGPGWIRSAKPVCRVWPVNGVAADSTPSN